MVSKIEQLHSRAAYLAVDFRQKGERRYIDKAIELARKALKRCPPDHHMRAISLTWLSLHLSDRYDRLGAMLDLEQAIVFAREALALCPQGHPRRPAFLSNLGHYLADRYKQLGTMVDLDEVIVLYREALGLHPAGHPHRPQVLIALINHLYDRYRKLWATVDIDEIIALAREALTASPPGHPDHPTSLTSLAVFLSDRYDQLGVMADLDETIVLARQALEFYPPGHLDRSESLANLAHYLCDRYRKFGAMVDLDEAIVLSRGAVALHPPGHPDRSMSLGVLTGCLSDRYDQLGAIVDLDEAVVLCRETLALCPPGHPEHPTSLLSLAQYLSDRYNRLGAMMDLDEAIVLSREGLVLHPPGHLGRSKSLSNLALYLSNRYDQLGAIVDLDEAIVLCREALALCPSGYPHRSAFLTNLARYLYDRYDQLRVLGDLDDAIGLAQEALALRPQGHPDRSTTLNGLGLYLSERYKHLGVIVDLDKALVLARQSLVLCPPGHPDRSTTLNNLAHYLSIRYRQFGAMVDLDEAIVLCREALALRPPGHPHYSTSLHSLANHLEARFTQTNQLQDKDEIFSLYARIAPVPQMVFSADLFASKAWIRVAEDFQHPTTLLAYETSLRLLTHHLATVPSLPQHLKVLKDLSSSLAIDAFSASLRNHSLTRAVELLEQGRGVFWTQLNRLRSPLDDVMASGEEGKTLADGFTHLTSLIRNALDQPGTDQHDRVWHLNIEMQQVVSKIRELPGLSRFLLPLLFSDLRQAAIGGPVIIVNASKYSCDALIILFDRDPIHIPLKMGRDGVRALSSQLHTLVVRAKRMDVTKELAAFLRELWDYVVCPIVDVLETIYPFHSRIWWCPTAEFSVLPLHAAGAYRTGQRRLSNLYISSYTTTLAALIRARQHAQSNSTTEWKRFVAIGQANATGESALNSVGAELANIGECVKNLTTFKSIEGADSCISRVAEELYENEWVHLACHGLPNRKEPFASAFGLYDGRFTIERIIRRELPSAEFAYLSACHTTVGDEDGPDEMIHLASAMQFAGFRSVIGTMWAVDDEQTNKITTKFYDNMKDQSGRLDHTRAAFALHKTMKEVRGISFDQRILYVHFGA